MDEEGKRAVAMQTRKNRLWPCERGGKPGGDCAEKRIRAVIVRTSLVRTTDGRNCTHNNERLVRTTIFINNVCEIRHFFKYTKNSVSPSSYHYDTYIRVEWDWSIQVQGAHALLLTHTVTNTLHCYICHVARFTVFKRTTNRPSAIHSVRDAKFTSESLVHHTVRSDLLFFFSLSLSYLAPSLPS